MLMLTAMRRVVPLMSTAVLCGCQMIAATAADASPPQQMESMDAIPQGCAPLAQSRNLIPIMATAKGSGRQCLVQDLVQRDNYDLQGNKGNPRRDGVLAAFRAKDADVDLRGHLVTGLPFQDTLGIHIQADATRIRIHNGVIRTPGDRGIGAWMAPKAGPSSFKFTEEDAPRLAYVFDENKRPVAVPWNYQTPPTQNTLENLKIESGGRGVVMAGTGNVLRNNTIEVDSSTAIVVYGPGAVIEGNTFIVHPRRDDQSATTAVLKLRDAHGAVIRNNRIVVKDLLLAGKGTLFSGKAEAAINLIDSRDVVIENNVVEGAKQLVRRDATSTTVERSNQIR